MAGVLAILTALTKIATGYWAAKLKNVDQHARWRAGVVLIARGEFSIVIAGLGASVEPTLEPVAAAYVLILAVAGPLLSRAVR